MSENGSSPSPNAEDQIGLFNGFFDDIPPDFAMHVQETLNNDSENSDNVVNNNLDSMNPGPQASDSQDRIDWGQAWNINSADNSDLINNGTGWIGTGPQVANFPTWLEDELQDTGDQALSGNLQRITADPQSQFTNQQNSLGRTYQDNNHPSMAFPFARMPPQNSLAYGNGYTTEHAPTRTISHGHVHQDLSQQGGYASLPQYNYIAPTSDHVDNAGAPTVDRVQVQSDQDAEGEDDSFDANREAENGIEGEEEGEEDDEEGEEDPSIDDGEFVVSDVTGMANIEKPGKVRKDNGYLEWYDPRTETWHRAVIHHNIRKALIKEAQAKHPGQRYHHPDPAGTGPSDITAFHVKYQTWGQERRHRPQILYQFDAPRDKQLRAIRPGPMKFRGQIVLNHQNNPVLDWNLPATLSSKTSGSNMEAWKRLLGVGQEDMRARMVRFTNEAVDGEVQRVALPDKNATINMPMQRFRDRAGCIAWSKRPGSDVLRAAVINLMLTEDFDPTITGSTEGFGRDFTSEEQLLVKQGNRGKAPYKARNQKPQEKGKRKRQSGMDGNNDRSPYDLIDLPGGDPSIAYPPPLESSENLHGRKRRRHGGKTPRVSGDHLNIGEDNPEPSVNLVQSLRASRREQKEKRPRRSQRKATRVLRPTQLEDSDDDDDDGADDMSGSEFSEDSEMSEDDIDVQPGNEDETMLAASASMFPTQPTGHFPTDAASSSQSRRLPQLGSQAHSRVPALHGSYSGHVEDEDLLSHRRNINNLLSGSVDTVADNSQPPQKRRDLKRKSMASEDQITTQSMPNQHRSTTSQTTASHEFLYNAEDTVIEDSQPLQKRRNLKGKGRAREDRANPQTISTQHRSATSQPTAGNVDCRKLSPMTEAERWALEEALVSTREAFFEYTGYVSPETDRNNSYFEQWEAIHEAFLEFNWTGHPRCINGEPPFLVQLPPWYTSIEDKPEHVKDSMYYEAWVYGFRAPRYETGELIVMNGEFLESIGKLDDETRKDLLDRALESKGFAPAYGDEEEDSEEEEEL